MRFILTSLFYLVFSFHALAHECELYEGFTIKKELCWDNDKKAFVSKDCLTQKCDALIAIQDRFPATTYAPTNSTSRACARIGAGVVVLRDPRKNELSFCEFEDHSLRDAASVELLLP